MKPFPLLLPLMFSLTICLLEAKDLWPWPMPHGKDLNVIFPVEDPIRIASVCLDGSLYIGMTVTDRGGLAIPVAMQVDTGSDSCLLKKEFASRFVVATQNGIFQDATVGQTTPEWVDLVTIDEAHLGPVEIRPFVLVTNSLVGLREEITMDGKVVPVIGLLGSNVIFRRSVHINLAENLFEWTEKNPLKQWDTRALTEAKEPMGMGPVYAVVPQIGEEGGAVLDTGAYSSLEPTQTTKKLSTKFPDRWIVEHPDGDLVYYGLREPRIILGKRVRKSWSVGMPGVQSSTWGTQILSMFDLWFDFSLEDQPQLVFFPLSGEPRQLDPQTRRMPPEFSLLVDPGPN